MLLHYYGGKSIHLRWLLPLVESIPHTCYVEPFGGGASVLLNKRRVPIEVYNDLDAFLTQWARVVQDPSSWSVFSRWVRMTPYARAVHHRRVCLPHPLVQAYAERMMSFSGIVGRTWRFTVASQTHWAFFLQARRLHEVHRRLQRVRIENRDFESVLRDYDSPDTLFYLDPPYLPETRCAMNTYRHEMSMADHERLLRCLVELRASVVLSGYPNPLYDALLDYGYERRDYTTRVNAANTKSKSARTESVWVRRVVV